MKTKDHVPDNEYVIKARHKLCPMCCNFVEFSKKQVYCTLCGTKLITECQKCAEPLLYPTARFCSVCGDALVQKKEIQH
jgi:hypothetical protein